jgi:hypothetical protein
MTTHAPLPEWTDLIAAAQKPAPDGDNLAAPWRHQGETAIWYSRGTWILAAVAEQLRRAKSGAPPIFWLPDYFCNQSTAALRDTRAKLVFYPIDAYLAPDWQRCEALATDTSPDVFLAVHYFGRPVDMARARAFCDANDALLFEDAAHVLRPLDTMGGQADLTLFCPHKTLPISDGAVLIERHAGTCPVPSGRAPGVGAWMTKRAVQKLLPTAMVRHRNRRQAPGFDIDPDFLQLPATPMMSGAAQRMVVKAGARIERIDEQRRRNARAVAETVAKMKLPLAPVFGTQGDAGFAPYRLVLEAPNTADAVDAYDVLVQAGFPVGTWPDLPPEVSGNPAEHQCAVHYRQSLIFLPIFSDTI